jgi:hypothetical protein
MNYPLQNAFQKTPKFEISGGILRWFGWVEIG